MPILSKLRSLYNEALDATIGKLDPFINEKQVETDPDKFWKEGDGGVGDGPGPVPDLLPIALMFGIAGVIAICIILLTQGV